MIRAAREDFIILTAENLDAFDTRTADHVVIPRLRRLNELVCKLRTVEDENRI